MLRLGCEGFVYQVSAATRQRLLAQYGSGNWLNHGVSYLRLHARKPNDDAFDGLMERLLDFRLEGDVWILDVAGRRGESWITPSACELAEARCWISLHFAAWTELSVG